MKLRLLSKKTVASIGFLASLIGIYGFVNNMEFEENIHTGDVWKATYTCNNQKALLNVRIQELDYYSDEVRISALAAFTEIDRFDGETKNHGAFELKGVLNRASRNFELKPLGVHEFVIKPKETYSTIGLIGQLDSQFSSADGRVWQPEGYEGCKDFDMEVIKS